MMRLSRHRLFGTAAATASWGALCHALVANRRGVITANASAPVPPVARVHFGFKLSTLQPEPLMLARRQIGPFQSQTVEPSLLTLTIEPELEPLASVTYTGYCSEYR